MIWTPSGPFRRSAYVSEADLEKAIMRVQADLFGPQRIYLPVKKKIGAKGGVRNIPDGYLVDLTGSRPRVYVVENELAAHDPLKHIAVQILQFSLSFASEGRGVKSILFKAIQEEPDLRNRCDEYAAARGFRNLDHLLEAMVFDAPFSALVIIDDLPDNLEVVLSEKFRFGVEVIELARYEDTAGKHFYRFEPFLADLGNDVAPAEGGQVDTVVVPAWPDGVEDTFLRENRWYAIRIHGTMRPQIKHIAVYQVAPVQAITHIAEVRSIEPWKDTGKYVVNFTSPATAIGPILLVKSGRVRPLQNLRYTTRARVEGAKTLDDIW